MGSSRGGIFVILACRLRARFVKGALPLFMLAMSVSGSVHDGRGGEKAVYIVVLGELIMICTGSIAAYC